MHASSAPVQVVRLSTGQLVQLVDGTNSDHLLQIVAHPQRDRSSPKSVSADRPILSIGQPIMKSPAIEINNMMCAEMSNVSEWDQNAIGAVWSAYFSLTKDGTQYVCSLFFSSLSFKVSTETNQLGTACSAPSSNTMHTNSSELPKLLYLVNEWCVGAPTEWHAVHKSRVDNKPVWIFCGEKKGEKAGKRHKTQKLPCED